MATAIDYASDPLSEILVATDFSPTSALVLERAIDLARRHGSEIALVHVMQTELPAFASAEMIVVPSDYADRLREASSKALEHEAARARAVGIPVTTHLEHGIPAQRITARADERGADLIVIGARGHTRFEHLLLGSVVESVVRNAHQPVLTVHPSDRRPIEPVGTLLFPTDLSPDSEAALDVAIRLLAWRPQHRILLVHTYHLAANVVPFTGFGDVVPPYFSDDAQEIAEAAAKPLVDRLRKRGFDVEAVVQRGEPSEVVLELAATRDVDVIAIATHVRSPLRRFLLGSTTLRVVEYASCPVLTVHPPAG
ncbi:universal stress protein [Myxococcota bacterium]|nr:universal stress protein [Myxococcota bacterium]